MRLVAPLALVLFAGCGGEPSIHRPLSPISDVRFDEVGGELWSFERRVSGRAPEGCVTVEIKRGPVLLRVPVIDGRFSGVVPLSPGENVLGAFCADPPFFSRDARLVYRVRLPAGPTARARFTAGPGAITLEAMARENAATHLPIAGYRWSGDPANPAPLSTRGGRPLERARARRVELSIPERDGEYVVWLEVHDEARRQDRAGLSFVVEGGRARALDRARAAPAWVERSVLYGPVDPSLGDEQLARLADLGVSALWLRSGDEREDERIRAFVERARAHALRILLDVELRRTPRDHPYLRHIARHGRRSPYGSLYELDGSAELALHEPEARRFVVESLVSLARELALDGFFVRDASLLALRAPRLLQELREELSRIDPRLGLIARAAAAPRFFDAASDPGPSTEDPSAPDEGEAASVFRALGPLAASLRRRSAEARSSLERVSATLLFTAPAIPSLRFDDEHAPESERARELRALARLRASEAALLRGAFTPLSVEPPGVYAFLRSAEGARPVVVVLALEAEVRRARVSIPRELAHHRRVVPLFGPGARAQRGRGVLVVPLGPRGARVFALE